MFSSSSGCWSKNCGWERRNCATSSLFIFFSQFHFSVENRLRRALHPHRIVAAGPRDGQRSAARIHPHGRIEQPADDAAHCGSTSAGPTGKRLACAALPYAKRDGVPVLDLHVARIHAIGEARVTLENG